MNQKISYYYKYNFVSPEPIYTQVKEELKSYFQTGVIDDILFPKYTEDCLRLLGKGSYKIEENVFKLEDYEFRLPDNFHAVRELWLVAPHEQHYQMPNSCYEQVTTRITPIRDRCNPAEYCPPDEIKVTYKTNGTVIQSFQCLHLLKPGNVNAQENCSMDSINRYSDSIDSFDIRNGKIQTNFPEGTVYMTYYVKVYDENQYQLIPDNQRIQDYIYAELYYQCFRNIYNNISDETIKQIESKMLMYKQERDVAKVIAQTETMKQTIEQQVRATLAARRRLLKYQIT